MSLGSKFAISHWLCTWAYRAACEKKTIFTIKLIDWLIESNATQWAVMLSIQIPKYLNTI